MSPRTRTKVPHGPIPTRLEAVRTDHGLSLNKFHKAVVSATGSDITYRSVQRYHTDDVAPVQYLIDVAAAFDVSLDWLCRGLGKPRQAPPDMGHLMKVTEGLSNSSDPVVQVSFWTLYERLLSAMPLAEDGSAGRYALTERQRAVVAAFLHVQLVHPLETIRGSQDGIPQKQIDQYLRNMLEGMRGIMAPVASGLSYKELLAGWTGNEEDDYDL